MPPTVSQGAGLLKTMNIEETRNLPYPQLHRKLLAELREAAEALSTQHQEFVQERDASESLVNIVHNRMKEHRDKLGTLEKVTAQQLADLTKQKEAFEKALQTVIGLEEQQMQSEAELARLNALKHKLEAKLVALDKPKREVEVVKLDLESTKQELDQVRQVLERQRETKRKTTEKLYKAKNELMQKVQDLQDAKRRKQSLQERRSMVEQKRKQLQNMLIEAKRKLKEMEKTKRIAMAIGWLVGLFFKVVSFFYPPLAVASLVIGVSISAFGRYADSRIRNYKNQISELESALDGVDVEMRTLQVEEKQTDGVIQSTKQHVSAIEEDVRNYQDGILQVKRSIQEFNTRNTTLSEQEGRLEGEMMQTKPEAEAARRESTDERNDVGQQHDKERMNLENVKKQLAQIEEQKTQAEKDVKQKHGELIETKHMVAIEKQAFDYTKQEERIHESNLRNMNQELRNLSVVKEEVEELQQKAVSSLRSPEAAEKALPGIQEDVQAFRHKYKELIEALYKERKEELRTFVEELELGLELDMEPEPDMELEPDLDVELESQN